MIAKIRYKVFGKSKGCLYLDQSLNKIKIHNSLDSRKVKISKVKKPTII